MQDTLGRLSASANGLIATGLALRARAEDAPLAPGVQARVDAVLDVLGLSDAIAAIPPERAALMLANIRGDLLLGTQVLCRDADGSGWSHDDDAILRNFGIVSAGFPAVLKTHVAPALPGLAARLDAPDARFLDVGVGVAELSMAMARTWPGLSVTGIDPWEPSLTIGRQNVAAAGLSDRIEMRRETAETLQMAAAFDLAWMPSAFVPEAMLQSAADRVAAALKPGGWLLLASVSAGDDPLAAAVAGFRTSLWGGQPLAPKAAASLLAQAGLEDVRIPALPPGAPVTITAARRA